MTKENPYYIPKENYKKVEEVREIDSKYEIPTFEEFMKTYKSPVNYADLNSADIGTQKGYGPCDSSSCSYFTRFYLKVGFEQDRLFNWHFREGSYEFEWIICESIEQARGVVRKLKNGTYRVVGATGNSTTTNAQNKREDVLGALYLWINEHERGHAVNRIEDLNSRSFFLDI